MSRYLQTYTFQENHKAYIIDFFEVSDDKNIDFPYFKFITKRYIEILDDNLLLFEKDSIRLNTRKGNCYSLNSHSKREICLTEVLTHFKNYQNINLSQK